VLSVTGDDDVVFDVIIMLLFVSFAVFVKIGILVIDVLEVEVVVVAAAVRSDDDDDIVLNVELLLSGKIVFVSDV